MQIHGILIFDGKRQDRLQNFPVILRHYSRLFHDIIQRNRAAAKKTFQQILAGVYGDTEDPRLFMFRTFKQYGTEGIFQKDCLRYVLSIRMIF